MMRSGAVKTQAAIDGLPWALRKGGEAAGDERWQRSQ